MKKQDQIYRLSQILADRRVPIGKSELARRLECSEKSVGRYLDELRDLYGAPIRYNGKGWFYDRAIKDRWQLPGLWLTKEETQSLLLLLTLLERFGNGLMTEELQGIKVRIAQLTVRQGIDVAALQQRIRVIPVGNRQTAGRDITQVVNALIARKRIRFEYEDFNGTSSHRQVSPQRLVYYRDNWYLHGWCHTRNALRNFSVARMGHALIAELDATEVGEPELEAHFESSYGAFSGEPTEVALLRFLPPMAAEIASQTWHTSQQGRWDDEDYLLEVPYSQVPELLRDVLRHLPHVIVEEPARLRDRLREVLAQAESLHLANG